MLGTLSGVLYGVSFPDWIPDKSALPPPHFLKQHLFKVLIIQFLCESSHSRMFFIQIQKLYSPYTA